MIRDNLLKAGDDGVSPREISHFAYPEGRASSKNKPRVAEWLRQSGYRVEDAQTGTGLVFHRKGSPFGSGFDAVTAEFRQKLPLFGSYYDGWKTWVIRKD